jgi:hypothetical protein
VGSIGVRAGQLGETDALLSSHLVISHMNMSAVIKLVTCRNSR